MFYETYGNNPRVYPQSVADRVAKCPRPSRA
jgi:hypothetical protein